MVVEVVARLTVKVMEAGATVEVAMGCSDRRSACNGKRRCCTVPTVPCSGKSAHPIASLPKGRALSSAERREKRAQTALVSGRRQTSGVGEVRRRIYIITWSRWWWRRCGGAISFGSSATTAVTVRVGTVAVRCSRLPGMKNQHEDEDD